MYIEQKNNKERPISCPEVHTLSKETDCAWSVLMLEVCKMLWESCEQVIWRDIKKAPNLTHMGHLSLKVERATLSWAEG